MRGDADAEARGGGRRHAAPCPADLPQAPPAPLRVAEVPDLVGILAAEAAVPSPPSWGDLKRLWI